jgi:hypothetical protein
MTLSRSLENCPSVLFIVYTPGPDAEAKGYEPWLIRVDNPFFNAIPGVRHYANWKIERVLAGIPPYTWFDFQGLEATSDLERVWFNKDLDAFRTEWVRLWGYGAGKPPSVQTNAYLMQPVQAPRGAPRSFALITGGRGEPPATMDLAWQVQETIRKHFSIDPAAGAWRVPIAQDNPLGADWIALTYGDSVTALAAAYAPSGEDFAFVARLVAAPEQT